MYCHRREFCTDGYEIQVLQGVGHDGALARLVHDGVVVCIGSRRECVTRLYARGGRETHQYEEAVWLPPTDLRPSTAT